MTHLPLRLSLLAQPAPGTDGRSMVTWLVLLAAMALLPFLLTMITSFAKLVIVGGILRQAMGTQQIPPNSVLTGLALLLTILIMWPVVGRSYQNYRDAGGSRQPAGLFPGAEFVAAAREPITRFLENNSDQRNIDLFAHLQGQLAQASAPAAATTQSTTAPAATAPATTAPATTAPATTAPGAVPGATTGAAAAGPAGGPAGEAMAVLTDMLCVRAPAFMLTELTRAFQIGFLLFVPFVIIDLVVGNVLLAMGMQMMTPATIALPIKLLLFILADGWRLIIMGLVLGYRM